MKYLNDKMYNSSNNGNNPLNILLVDDDEVDRRIIKRCLCDSGLSLSIHEMDEPSQAIELMSTTCYDCLLLDYRFPTGNSLDLFAEVLNKPCSQRPSIILLTGQGDEKIAAESIQRGAQEYMSKQELGTLSIRRTIESACEKSAMQKKIEMHDEELAHMSFYDSLTNLPNRRLFYERLGQIIRDSERTKRKFAVMMMDLNLFKAVNDSFGHAIGDKLLVQVANRIQKIMRHSDTLARLGGDEFATILSTTDSVEGAIIVAEKIIASLEEPFIIDEHLLDIGVSIGLTIFPIHGADAEELLSNADIAMYDSKHAGRGLTIFGSKDNQTDRTDMLIAQGLRTAIVKQELFAMFQPQINMIDGKIIGAEALVRWHHPQLGLLPPSKFIPAAERSEHIEAMTYFMLGTALEHVKKWLQHDASISVSVNLSARLLEQDNVVKNIDSLLHSAGVKPHCLCLEVTETGIMSSPDLAERTLQELSSLGIKISIDDFGTGYSSLKYLRNFPIDEIKIDRLFVSNLPKSKRDELIVESILALGKAFHVSVLAEGIEDVEVTQRLIELGCQYGQGYHFAKPMIATEFEDWLKNSQLKQKDLKLSIVNPEIKKVI